MHQITDADFDRIVLKETTCPVVVLFHTANCPPCADVKAEMALLERQYADQAVVVFVEVTQAQETARRYVGKGGVPLVVLFHAGTEVWRRLGGSTTASSLSPWLDDLLAGSRPLTPPR